MITSQHNPALQDVRRLLARKRTGSPPRFVAEGEDLLAAADAAGWAPLLRLRAGEDVSAEALARVSSLASGTRELGVYEERWSRPAGPTCVALWGVGDPGNVGTVLRGALAFGAASVVIGPGTADPYGPKAVRASMGAIFRVPLASFEEPAGARVALVARGGVPLPELQVDGDVVFGLGAERAGLPADVAASCDVQASIPQPGGAESLNVAMAGAIALYERSRAAR